MTRVRSLIGWFRNLSPFVKDGALGLLLAALTVSGMWAAASFEIEGIEFRDPDALGVTLSLLQTLPLAWRRTKPLQTFAVVLIATTLFFVANYASNFSGVGILVCLYTVAAICERRPALIAAGATAVALALSLLVWPEGVTADVWIGNYVIFATAWILGENVRNRRAVVRELEERARRLEREREVNSIKAVADERARIARELHDVVAHSVSVMVVQAGAGRRVVESGGSPEAATEALASIETTGRQALTEMRRLLGVLRHHNGGKELAPQPTIEQLDSLFDQVREAGVPVEVTVEGEPRPLSSGVALSAYRIVQEALTNTMKHAGPATARVTITYRSDEIQISIVDNGRGLVQNLVKGTSPGHGLVGMKERVTLFGGQLEAGPRNDGGFEVTAHLPLEPART